MTIVTIPLAKSAAKNTFRFANPNSLVGEKMYPIPVDKSS